MTACTDCQALSGQPSNSSPHFQLMRTKTVDLGAASHGRATGVLIYYFCKICGSNLQCDRDETDNAPTQWTIVKEG